MVKIHSPANEGDGGREDFLEKEMATHSRETWQATVHGVAKSQT